MEEKAIEVGANLAAAIASVADLVGVDDGFRVEAEEMKPLDRYVIDLILHVASNLGTLSKEHQMMLTLYKHILWFEAIEKGKNPVPERA